jgi:LPS-assembly lipoprotein
VVLSGTSYGRASFERNKSIFSNVRAREDAENRAAKVVGEDLKSRLSAHLAGA